MIKKLVFCVSVIPLFAMIVSSQTIRNYENFQAEFDSTGKTIGLTLPGSPGSTGCTNPNYKKGVITAVRYDESYKNGGKHVSGISVRYSNGKFESFDEDGSYQFSIWELPAKERQLLESLFTPNRPVTIGIYYCGTASYKILYSIKDNSKQSSALLLGPASAANQNGNAASRSWPKFWAEYRAAINRRDKVTLTRMMSSPFAVNCTLEGSPPTAEQWLNKVDDAYWRRLQKMMASGTKLRNSNRRPQRVTKGDPEDTQLFEFGTDGRWRWLGCSCFEC